MNRDHEAIVAAREALQIVNEAVDAIVSKATQLESLLVLLAHTAHSEELPSLHRENVCWLGSVLADEIRTASALLAASS